MAGKKQVTNGPQIMTGLGRGDFVILKRHMNKKGEISKRARLGNIRKTSPDGHEVMWQNKSDQRQSMSRKSHKGDSLYKVDGKTAKKVSQFLHKHIASKTKPTIPVDTPTPDAPTTPDTTPTTDSS